MKLTTMFPEYVTKWFSKIATNVTETINGKKEAPTYRFKTMLTEVFKLDLKWASLSKDGSIVAADVVAMDSSLPLKKRDSISKATGDIPKLGMALKLGEKQLSDITILVAQGGTEGQVVSSLFADTKKCIVGIEERLEMMFLQSLSSGVLEIPDTENVGTSIRATVGIPDTNRFGVTKAWGDPEANVIDDLENVITKASDDRGVTINYILMDKVTRNNIRKSNQVRALYAADLGLTGTAPVPTIAKFNELIGSELGVQIEIIDRSVRVELNGKRTSIRPFAENTVVFLTSLNVGELQYGRLVEESHPVENVNYEKATSYTLVSKYHTNDPFAEHTTSQALVIPVLQNVDEIFIMDTQECEVLADTEVDDDNSLTIWGEARDKGDILDAYNAIMGTSYNTSGNMKSDENVIKLINELSDEDEAAVKEHFLAL